MEHIVVIDTNRYAGNFERDMCAYITGQVGDCGVGEEFAEIAEDELTETQIGSFNENVRSKPDDHGCWRPCSIWESNIGEYNSVAIFFYEAPDKETMQLIHSRALSFTKYKEGLFINGIRLFEVIPETYRQVKF